MSKLKIKVDEITWVLIVAVIALIDTILENRHAIFVSNGIIDEYI